jgi:hypothetical protein
MDDHRITPRQRVLKAGIIEFGDSKVDCLIRNVSATGAALEVNSPLWFPDVFVLVMTSDGSSRRCHIVWRNEKRIGVTFDD